MPRIFYAIVDEVLFIAPLACVWRIVVTVTTDDSSPAIGRDVIKGNNLKSEESRENQSERKWLDTQL